MVTLLLGYNTTNEGRGELTKRKTATCDSLINNPSVWTELLDFGLGTDYGAWALHQGYQAYQCIAFNVLSGTVDGPW